MSEKSPATTKIVQDLLAQPEAEEIRRLALEISQLIAQTRGLEIFKDLLKKPETPKEIIEQINNLIEDFKNQVAELLQINLEDLKASNPELYDKIIYPLVISQLERSA